MSDAITDRSALRWFCPRCFKSSPRHPESTVKDVGPHCPLCGQPNAAGFCPEPFRPERLVPEGPDIFGWIPDTAPASRVKLTAYRVANARHTSESRHFYTDAEAFEWLRAENESCEGTEGVLLFKLVDGDWFVWNAPTESWHYAAEFR